jgi:hypothetical protein
MQEIQGKAKTIRELLKGVKYGIDYYQREYRWKQKQVQELIQDLTSRFLDDHEEDNAREDVERYGHYFLGSIITSKKNGQNFIVDGQQRLTSLTLLLIFLHNLQKEREDAVDIGELIFSTRFGKKSFNIEVEERADCMEALFDDVPFDPTDKSESVQNIIVQYQNIQEGFPAELTEVALPYFIDWLIENVHMVEITTYSDEDAYTVFETMNDRGLSLTPTEMLKGYLLSNITGDKDKAKANNVWKQRIQTLNELGKDSDADCIKAWLRSQYARTIRPRKKGAKPEEFDLIGTEFHRYVRDHHERLGLNGSNSFLQFIERDFAFFARQYGRLMKAAETCKPGLETVYFNADHGFTLQYMVLLAPLKTDDSADVIDRKLRLVGTYLDIMLNRRLWNFRSIAYSTMSYTMFILMRDIRRFDPEPLAQYLQQQLAEESETFVNNDRLYMHKQNRWYLHRILARMTAFVEEQSGMTPRYVEYTRSRGKNRYEVEHIWADKPDRHADEFPHPNDFSEYRNRIGGLLLLPKSFNASYGSLPYEDKLDHYNSQNILARSLHSQCYERNPGFVRFVTESRLPFRPHAQFKQADLDARQALYQSLAKQVWNPGRIEQELGQ